jgi:NADH:ubiquinone oxidoreductase subunit C
MGIGRYFLYYNLISIKNNFRMFIRTLVPSSMIITSIINIYPGCNWLEREIWDFFGIFFYEHGDLRRILTDYGFEGFLYERIFL